MEKPITFTVDRIRDGKSFTTRSVKAIQDAEVIFNCSISFQKREKGLEHQVDMPDVPEPETLKSEQELREDILKELKMKKEDMPMFFRQQEIEMRKAELGKDSETIANVTKDQEDKGPEVKEEEPLVQQPEVTSGDKPGIPASMKNKQTQNESEFIQTLKKLSGQI